MSTEFCFFKLKVDLLSRIKSKKKLKTESSKQNSKVLEITKKKQVLNLHRISSW